ncbi:cell wall metabolism sensor histidine kinase WalK [Dehalococcoidia bacterium]|nr:cell wall metabolism sensor histidine kinase WalK [Dehalococcoidia bacterium]
MNLLSNASKFSPEGTSITLSARAEGGELIMEGLRTFGSGYVEGMGRGQLVRPVFQAKLEEASTSTGAHFCALER